MINNINLIVPASVKEIEALTFKKILGKIKTDAGGLCTITFYGSPAIETGAFGTPAEIIALKKEMYEFPELWEDTEPIDEMLDDVCISPESLLVRAYKTSCVIPYCEHFGIRYEVMRETMQLLHIKGIDY